MERRKEKGVWVVEKHLYDELHKRVGHITVMQARHGAYEWPMEKMTLEALDQWISFFGEQGAQPRRSVGIVDRQVPS